MATGIATKCSVNDLAGTAGSGASADPAVQSWLDSNCTDIVLNSENCTTKIAEYNKIIDDFFALLDTMPSSGYYSATGADPSTWSDIWEKAYPLLEKQWESQFLADGGTQGEINMGKEPQSLIHKTSKNRKFMENMIIGAMDTKPGKEDSVTKKRFSEGSSGRLPATAKWDDPAYSNRLNGIIRGRIEMPGFTQGQHLIDSNPSGGNTWGSDAAGMVGVGDLIQRKLRATEKLIPQVALSTSIARGSLYGGAAVHSADPTPTNVSNEFKTKALTLIRAAKTKMAELGPGDATPCGKLADLLDEYGKKSLQAAGVLIARGPGSAASRAGGATRLTTRAAGGLSGITIEVSRDIRYKEQCILLSQIAPLSQYRRNLDMRYGRRLPYDAVSPTSYWTGKAHPADANAPLLVDGESFGFMNRLTQYGNMRQFFDMTNAEIAGLQPLIRLFKVRDANSTSAKSSEQEIYFDSYATDKDVKDIFKNKNKRGFGVGIKSFNVVFDGQDMFAQKKSIKATLKLHANSFEELLRPRTLRGRTFRYIDLALKTGKTVIEKRPELDELNFRLKAVFGWVPIKGKNNVLSPEVRNALNGTFVSVNLTPVTHNFDFDDMGRVTFTIEYFAYVDEFYDKPRMNIFTHPQTYAKMLSRKIAFESAEQDASCDTDQGKIKEIAALKKEDVKNIEGEKVAMLNRLFSEMFQNEDIYFLNLSREQLKAIIAEGPHYEFATGLQVNRPGQPLNASLQGDIADSWKRAIRTAPRGTGRKEDDDLEASLLAAGIDSKQIPFFYVGDLLDLIIGSMGSFLQETKALLQKEIAYAKLTFNEEIKKAEINALEKSIEEYKKLRIMLGPLEIVNHGTGDQVYINFADVPVSVAYASEWLTSKLLKKDQAIYPLVQFMKDLFNDLLKQFLNNDTCYPFSIKQKVRLFQSVVTSYPNSKQQPDEISALAKSSPGNRLDIFKAHENYKNQPFLQISGKSDFNNPNPGIANEMNYFVFYAGRTQPMNLMNGRRKDDEDRGIFHYLLGKDRGIVKNIQLNKTSTPGLKEVRFEQEGFDGLRQLREIYDVDVDTYANIRAFPGNYIFVDPKGFDPSLQGFSRDGFDLTDLGVGGYFMVIRSEHQFEAGVADTKLTAVWVASALGANSALREQNIIEQNSGANAGVKAKCASKRSKDAKTRMKQSVEDETIVGGYGGGTRVEYPS